MLTNYRKEKIRLDIRTHIKAHPADELPDKLIEYMERVLQGERQFYLERFDNLQTLQAEMPEPWRTEVCDILANGQRRSFKRIAETKADESA